MNAEAIKEAVRARDGHRCVECGMTSDQHFAIYGRKLDVHRTTPGSAYTAEGCMAVCRRCHASLEKRPAGTPSPDRAGLNVNLYLKGELGDAFAQLLEDFVPRTGKKSHLKVALREYLVKLGYLQARAPKHPPK